MNTSSIDPDKLARTLHESATGVRIRNLKLEEENKLESGRGRRIGIENMTVGNEAGIKILMGEFE